MKTRHLTRFWRGVQNRRACLKSPLLYQLSYSPDVINRKPQVMPSAPKTPCPRIANRMDSLGSK
jgi:hypothetical protein